MPHPRQPAPALHVDTVAHGPFDLAAQKPERFTLICYYRGLHCPICATYLRELERLVPDFAQRGVETIAISSDEADRARQMAEKINASGLRIGYGLDLAERALSEITIDPPKPWFWTPAVENSTVSQGATIEALHTIKATAFGTNLLRIYLGFEDGKVKRVAAEVVCHFG